MSYLKSFINFIKKETLLIVSFVLAVISAFIVHPDSAYLGYVDLRVLGILLSLMLVVSGLKQAGLFDAIGMKLLNSLNSTLSLGLVLILLCFFMSMLITNDVALITFVPFAIYTLSKCNQNRLILPVVVLQTIAANLGSMLTPVGNPQNLYIYQTYKMSITDFFKILLPYTLAALALLVICAFIFLRSQDKIQVNVEAIRINKKELLIYGIFFALCLLVVLKIIPYYAVLAVIVIYLIIFDKYLLAAADYSLLFTFVFFFIFTGNLGRISAISDTLYRIIEGRETLTAVALSQIISNVPATLLLSTFTDNYHDLLIGVNLGGLGTLIASMASLISYKQFAAHDNPAKGKYFRFFTISNIIFLIIMLGLNWLIG